MGIKDPHKFSGGTEFVMEVFGRTRQSSAIGSSKEHFAQLLPQ